MEDKGTVGESRMWEVGHVPKLDISCLTVCFPVRKQCVSPVASHEKKSSTTLAEVHQQTSLIESFSGAKTVAHVNDKSI